MKARPGRASGGVPPGTDPICLLITTVAVLIGLAATGLTATGVSGARLTAWPGRGESPFRTAMPGTGPAGVTHAAARGRPRSAETALRLLATAAGASGTVAYQGVEMVAWWGPQGTNASVADVWHQAGREPAVRPLAPGVEWPAGFRDPAPVPQAGRELAAVPGLSPRLAGLLAANYTVALAGRGAVAGRPAVLVTVRRADGTLAAIFWLDRATKLPLRRQTYGTSGGLLSEEAFLSLTVGRAAAVPGQAAQPWREELATDQLAGLRSRGWPLPGPLPGSLDLVDARETQGPSGPVVHLAYSDGLSAVSVFVQRGTLPPRPSGWSRITLAGHPVYAGDPDDGSIAWSARGFVFTVIAQAPQPTLAAVVGALPHAPAPRPGVLDRVATGARRLLTWLGLQR